MALPIEANPLEAPDDMLDIEFFNAPVDAFAPFNAD
jgi:hypothetical protein